MSVYPQFENNYRSLLYDALEHTYECILLTDAEGYILYMNKPYQDFLQVNDVRGKHVTEVIENTRMHIVAQTGKAEIADIQRIRGHDMIANRIPVIRDGHVTAVIGTVMFQDVQQLYALAATVDRLRKEVDYYKGELRRKTRAAKRPTTSFDDIIGNDPKMLSLKNLAMRVAKSNTTVLITGESGTGKELFARAVHAASPRGMGPFISVNCAAIPDTLLESELFGYEGGAFTGASPTGKRGKFELADRGTILLDEIGDMPLALQAKLLRVLQEREIERVGGAQPIPVDVRIISSTHQDMAKQIRQGHFREDLFYRLNVMNLHIPPLRERGEDIRRLSVQILNRLQTDTHLRVDRIADAVWEKLNRHSWPGNVRELKNVLERALHLMDYGVIEPEHITFPFSSADTVGEQDGAVQFEEVSNQDGITDCSSEQATHIEPCPVPLRNVVAQAEQAAIRQALKIAGGDKREAARLLGVSKSTLYQKLLDYRT